MIHVHDFSQSNSLCNTFLAELRDKNIQTDPLRFRKNLERMGEIFAYEISKELEYTNTPITSPLGTAQMSLMTEQPVVATILRAGLPLHQGILNFFDRAGNCFMSAYRKHTTGDDFEIELEYMASPNLEGKVVILADPMLASGASMVAAYEALKTKGMPKHIHVVSSIASKAGVEFVKKHFPKNTTLWMGAVDDEMNPKSYIIPGLGDAGDLAFGEKEDA